MQLFFSWAQRLVCIAHQLKICLKPLYLPGGVGINLIGICLYYLQNFKCLTIPLSGASRLCLVDSDWNPRYAACTYTPFCLDSFILTLSHDLQSMARCHRWAWSYPIFLLLMSWRKRDGQKRPVYIYRFLTAGTIDGGLFYMAETSLSCIDINTTEKIFQRQVTKLGLSNCKWVSIFKWLDVEVIIIALIGTVCWALSLVLYWEMTPFKGSTSTKSDSFSRKDVRCLLESQFECVLKLYLTASRHIPDTPRYPMQYPWPSRVSMWTDRGTIAIRTWFGICRAVHWWVWQRLCESLWIKAWGC